MLYISIAILYISIAMLYISIAAMYADIVYDACQLCAMLQCLIFVTAFQVTTSSADLIMWIQSCTCYVTLVLSNMRNFLCSSCISDSKPTYLCFLWKSFCNLTIPQLDELLMQYCYHLYIAM